MHIDFTLMIVQVATFLIGLFIVWKLAWKTIVNMVDERNLKIKTDLENAEKSKTSAAQLENELKQQWELIKQKSQEQILLARSEAGKIREEMLKKAQSEADDLLQKTRQQLDHEQKKIVQQLQPYIVDLSFAICKKILADTADERLHKKQFDDILVSLQSKDVRNRVA